MKTWSREIENTISHRAYDQTARDIERYGLYLTWAQAQEIDLGAHHWLQSRLGLSATTDDSGVTYSRR